MKLRTPLALAGAAAMTITTGLVTTATTSQAAATKSFAYGVSINGEGKQPYVESTDGSPQTQGTPEFPTEFSPLLAGTVAALEAGDDFASIRLADLTIGAASDQLPQEVKDGIDQLTELCTQAVGPIEDEALAPILTGIRENAPTEVPLPEDGDVLAFCDGLLDGDLPALLGLTAVEVQCDGDAGRVTVAGVTILGAPVPVAGNIPRDTQLFAGEATPLAEAVQVTFNRQTKRPDGSFSVDGAVISLGGGEGEIILGHTTCGQPLPRRAEGRAPVNKPAPQAEAPEPVRQSVPVTG